MTDTVTSKVHDFIIENFLFGDTEYKLDHDASLIESDVIDSTGVLELVAFIEETFELEVDDEDIVPANLDSVASITAFVQRKASGTQSAA